MTKRARVVVYSRPGCHLCDEAKLAIRDAGCAELYDLEEVNIESDPELVRRYGSEIPVILINGIKAFKYRVRAEDFRKRLSRKE